MEQKKNIIYITGKDAYGIDHETSRFIEAFRLRQDANNIDIFRIEEVTSWGSIMQSMQTMGIFVEKRLFVFSGSLKKEVSRSGEETKAMKKNSEAEAILLRMCEEISDDTFLILSGVDLDPKSPLLIWLGKYADIRRYDDIWGVGAWSSRYPSLSADEIKSTITKYRQAEGESSDTGSSLSYALAGSLEKLTLLKQSRAITSRDIEESLFLESSGKMYDFTDAILRGDSDRALRIFHLLLESMNIHAFLASLIGLMRTSIYIRYYKHLGKSQNEISNLIQAHPYVIQKTYESRIPYEKLYSFYEKVLGLNTAYRSGKGRKDPELGRIFDIELAIMGLKK